jgi:hypothetical protein
MFRTTLLFTLTAVVAGCATGDVQRPEATALRAENPVFVENEPLHSPDLAVTLAELALASQGHDSRGYQQSISYCEGTYTITFRDADSGGRYQVDIDASNSRVTRVTMPRPAAEPAPSR